MSRSKRCLESCFRSLRSNVAGNSIATTRRVPVVRYYGQAAASQSVPEVTLFEPASNYRRTSQRQPSHERDEQQEDDLGGFGRKPESETAQSALLAEHLNKLFSPLNFPPDLAHRIMTHGSHVSAKYGSNGNLGFSGRRVLECYLNLFLNSSSALKPSHDLAQIAEKTLSSNLLGEQLGSRWGYSKVIQWTPAVSRSELEAAVDPDAIIKRIGLYKVQGDAVAATIGGIYFQFGASVAHRFFHTRMLPHLSVNGGLPSVFQGEAEAVCKRMGGPNGNLLHLEKRELDFPPSPSPSAS